jgi:hypothetical protein
MLMGSLGLEVRHDPVKNLRIAAGPQRNAVARASTVAMCPYRIGRPASKITWWESRRNPARYLRWPIKR